MRNLIKIASLLSALILAFAVLVPSLHVFQHQHNSGDTISFDYKDQVSSKSQKIDCLVCDFHLQTVEIIQFNSYQLHSIVIFNRMNVSYKNVNYTKNLVFTSLRDPPFYT